MKMGRFERFLLILAFILFCIGSGAMTVKIVTDRLSDDQVMMLVGGGLVLILFCVVGGLFMVSNYMQTKSQLAMLAQDDSDEMQKMVKMWMMVSGGGRQPNINLRLPGGGQSKLPNVPVYMFPDSQRQQQPVDGDYHDTISVE